MQSTRMIERCRGSARMPHIGVSGRASLLATLLFLGWCAGQAQPTPPGAPLQSALLGVEHALAENDFDRAISLSHAALQTHPGDVRLWTLSGMAYVGAGKLPSAVASYRHALKLGPNYLPALEGIAQIEYQQNASDAAELLQRILEVRPADPTAHAMLGAIQYKSGNCKSAVTHFQSAEPLIRSNFVALSEFAVCLSKAGRLEDAVAILQEAVALQPESQQARYNLALTLWKSKKDDEALRVLDPLLQVDQTALVSHLGDAAFVLAADIYESRNDTPHAVELLRKSIAWNPRHLQSYLSFATLCNDHAAYQVGIDMLNLGISQMPKSAQLYSARGVLYAQLGNFQHAMVDFETADQIDPLLSSAGVAEGVTLAQTHDYANAVATFRKEARRHPANALDQYLLAETLFQHGIDVKSAEYAEQVSAAKKAVQLDPHFALAHNLLSRLYLREGKTALAIEQCETVLKTDPTNQESLYHLILALRSTDRKGEIPVLTKRLADLRAAADEREARTVRYKLVEVPASTNTAVRELPN